MASDDIYVLKGEIKRKMQQLQNVKIEFEKFKASFGKKIADIMSDKMSIQFESDNISNFINFQMLRIALSVKIVQVIRFFLI